MIVKVTVHRGKTIRFNQETGELFIYCNNQASKNQFPISVHVAHGETEQDYHDNKDLESATVKVGERGSLSFVDKERRRTPA